VADAAPHAINLLKAEVVKVSLVKRGIVESGDDPESRHQLTCAQHFFVTFLRNIDTFRGKVK
jgi:hypothetical protein